MRMVLFVWVVAGLGGCWVTDDEVDDKIAELDSGTSDATGPTDTGSP